LSFPFVNSYRKLQSMDDIGQKMHACKVAQKQYEEIADQRKRLEVELSMMEGQKLQLAERISEVIPPHPPHPCSFDF
jgi:hypothetical protein